MSVSNYYSLLSSLNTLDASLNRLQNCVGDLTANNSLTSTEGKYYVKSPTTQLVCSGGSDLTTVLNSVNDAIRILTASPNGLIYTFNNDISNSDPTQNNELKQKYAELLTRRRALDLKAQELYSNRASGNDMQELTDSAVYGTLLWTILATSLVYYVFIKM